MRFEPLAPNPDLDIHPDPPGIWRRVVVVGFWTSAADLRKRWPDAACVGPLRTPRGIDELLRNILFNEQIRVIVLDGPDLSDGQRVSKTLQAFWAGDGNAIRTQLAPELHAPVSWLAVESALSYGTPTVLHLDSDRPAGRVVLPPAPVAEPEFLPPGDPGQCVVTDTLAEVWPRVLDQVLRFGRRVPTQYGETAELLNLVSVIRDPAKSLDEIRGVANDLDEADSPASGRDDDARHPVLGFSWADLDRYYETSTTAKIEDGQVYSYGSRLTGRRPECGLPLESDDDCCGRKPGHDGPCSVSLDSWHVDQLAAIDRLLTEKPDTRAAFATPWRPDTDAGLESGRPCLVGLWPRCVDGELHWTVHYRSHDLWQGYPRNLAVACRMLVETAERHNMKIGTVTCLSMSAHVYAKSYDEARALVAKHPEPKLQLDQRANWRVFTRDGRLVAEATSTDGARVLAAFEAPASDAGVERLRADILRSGLVTSIGNGLWLGSELQRLLRETS